MEQESSKLITPMGGLIDIVLSVIFFATFTFKIIPSHVPSYDPFWVTVFSAFCSLPITGVFWFAAGYLRATMIDELKRAKKA